MTEDIRRWSLRYRWWVLRLWLHGLPDRLCWHLAYWLPRRVALFAFVRVYASTGDGPGPEYERIYRTWTMGRGR